MSGRRTSNPVIAGFRKWNPMSGIIRVMIW
jgi:hypothetical protein